MISSSTAPGEGQAGLHLRPYRQDDLTTLHAIDAECFAEPFRFSLQSLLRFIETPQAITLIAEQSDRVEGLCVVHMHRANGSTFGYVVTLDVRETARRKGAGRFLLLAGENLVHAQGAASMRLHVFSGNPVARQFYHRLGYGVLRHAENFYGESLHALVMAKRLAGTGPLPVAMEPA